MHPILIHTRWLDIYTYGVLVAAGFLIGLAIAAHRARRAGLRPEQISDLGVWLIVSGMLGGKLFHVIFFWDEFIRPWLVTDWSFSMRLRSLREGFVFYGGFIVATLTMAVYARAKRLPLAKVADLLAPCIAFGHAFGRLGCFFNGCCYGKACTLPWAVKFPSPHVMAGIPLHPTQLYEVIGNVVLFLGLSAFAKHKRFDGQIWWLYVLSYGVLRFVIEFFRGDYERYYFGGFTLGHAIAAAMIVVALVALARLHPQAQKASSRIAR
jgi:phosphatidylglycerol---prolipoprotein diacylglyceryl transferase